MLGGLRMWFAEIVLVPFPVVVAARIFQLASKRKLLIKKESVRVDSSDYTFRVLVNWVEQL